MAIFDKEEVTIRKGEWGNPKKMKVVRRSLDADRDGHPEQIRYFDEKTGELLRKELDQDYDGKLDSWSVYTVRVDSNRSTFTCYRMFV